MPTQGAHLRFIKGLVVVNGSIPVPRTQAPLRPLLMVNHSPSHCPGRPNDNRPRQVYGCSIGACGQPDDGDEQPCDTVRVCALCFYLLTRDGTHLTAVPVFKEFFMWLV